METANSDIHEGKKQQKKKQTFQRVERLLKFPSHYARMALGIIASIHYYSLLNKIQMSERLNYFSNFSLNTVLLSLTNHFLRARLFCARSKIKIRIPNILQKLKKKNSTGITIPECQIWKKKKIRPKSVEIYACAYYSYSESVYRDRSKNRNYYERKYAFKQDIVIFFFCL